MTFTLALQQAQQVAADTAQVATDTLATTPLVDTTSADTTNALAELSRGLGEASGLLISGQWELFIRTLYQGMADLIVSLIPKVVGALFVFLLFYMIYRMLRSLLHRLLGRSKNVDIGLENLLLQTFRLMSLSLIAVMVLSQLGVNVAALLAGLGIAGIAVGFAARDTLENFIAGITILIDRPFRIGDNIVVEDTFGTVHEITLRSTRMRTLNNEMMVMPNAQMINQKLINHTMLQMLRVEVPFGIAYKEYPAQARQVVLGLTEGDTRLHPDFPPQVVVTRLNDSSVDMALRVYLNNPKQEVPVRLDYTEKIREAFREADIEIPFPHLQLFVDEAKAFDNTSLMKPLLPPPNEASSD